MAPKLTPEEGVTLAVLKQKGQSNIQIAQTLVSAGSLSVTTYAARIVLMAAKTNPSWPPLVRGHRPLVC